MHRFEKFDLQPKFLAKSSFHSQTPHQVTSITVAIFPTQAGMQPNSSQIIKQVKFINQYHCILLLEGLSGQLGKVMLYNLGWSCPSASPALATPSLALRQCFLEVFLFF